MMKPARILRRAILAAMIFLPAVGGGAGAAEDSEIDLFSVGRAQGNLVQTGEATLQFLGVLQGSLYVQTDEGPVRAGAVVCSATLDIDSRNRSQSGAGRCTMTGEDGNEVFGDWKCSGYFLLGCSGPFTITGGTGRFKGISGQGPVTFRSAVGNIGVKPGEASANAGFEGIVFWRKLQVRTP